ncbi:ferredoxin family protein [Candidatus Bathyarchaeota archaeon]|nr:ferredoxin family protein [Candidatus Bathyarchaeota archaeon]
MPPTFNDNCITCFKCVEICPTDILQKGEKKPVVAYPEECWHCGACMMDCPTKAIRINLPLWLRPLTKRVKK